MKPKAYQVKQLSPDLEQSLVAAFLAGLLPLGTVPEDALSKLAKESFEAASWLASKGHKAPFTRNSVLSAAVDFFGADASELRPYLAAVLKVGVGREIDDLLLALDEQESLRAIVNEASNQLETREFNPGAFLPLLESRQTTGLVSAGDLLKDDKLPPIPTGVPIALPRLQEATGGLFGVWAIGGKPKMGKSTLAVQLSLEVAKAMPVLYYDMENGEQVFLYRVGCMFQGDIKKVREATKQLYIRSSSKDLDKDVLAVPAPALIVVDSLQKLPTKLDQRRTGIDAWLLKFEQLKRRGYTVLLVSELNGFGGYKETGEVEYTVDLGLQLIGNGDFVTVNCVANRHRKHVGEICNLERSNDWSFVETDDFVEGPNQGGDDL
jgi:KaiC/GvpD/RAD55 family RecA-like ATPase